MSSTSIYSLSDTLAVVQQKLSFTFSLVFILVGITGCFLNILLFSRRQFRAVSCCTYFLWASVAMAIQLSFFAGTLIYSCYFQNPVNYIVAYCKMWFYLLQSTGMMFRWLLTAACIDRYALSSTNVRLRRFANIRIARRVVAAIIIISILLPIPLLVFYGLRASVCVILYDYAASLFTAIFIIFNTYAVPVPIMIICTLRIRQNLANKRERRNVNTEQQQRTNNREDPNRKRDQQALAMLFAQIFVYIILTTPWVIFSVYNAVAMNVPNKSVDRLAIERFMLNFVALIISLFPTVSFYLYTLTSSLFRKELFTMLHLNICCKCFINNRRVVPITANVQPRAIIVQ